MAKLGIFASIIAFVGILGTAAFVSADDDSGPCKRTDYKTEMVKAACTKGTKDKKAGQDAAKDVMKAFNKEHNIKSCNECHSKLSPTYELKADGLEKFQKYGGK